MTEDQDFDLAQDLERAKIALGESYVGFETLKHQDFLPTTKEQVDEAVADTGFKGDGASPEDCGIAGIEQVVAEILDRGKRACATMEQLVAAASGEPTDVDRKRVKELAAAIRTRRAELLAKGELTADEVAELEKLDRAVRGDLDDDLRRKILAAKRRTEIAEDGRVKEGTIKNGVLFKHPPGWSDQKVKKSIKRALAARKRLKLRRRA